MRIAATVIDHIVHSAVTEDGRHMALIMADVETNPITLGIPCELLPELVDASARALADSERIHRRGWDPQARIAVTWWTLNRDETPDSLLLSLTFGSGDQLSFALTQHMAAALRDSLVAYLDPARRSERGFGSRCASADQRQGEAAAWQEAGRLPAAAGE